MIAGPAGVGTVSAVHTTNAADQSPTTQPDEGARRQANRHLDRLLSPGKDPADPAGRTWLAPVEVPAGVRARDLLQFPDLIGDAGVDDDLLGLGEELDERAQAPAHELEHRQGDVHPPLIAGDLVEEVLLGPDDRDGALVEQPRGDLLDLPAHLLGTRVGFEHAQLQSEGE